MHAQQILAELSAFGLAERAFEVGELLDCAAASADRDAALSTVSRDPRFVRLRSKPPAEDRFVLDSTLFRWFGSLNIRLARVGEVRLTEHQVAAAISSLRVRDRWDTPPAGAIVWGLSLGLIGESYSPGYYVFPLAQVLYRLRGRCMRAAMRLLRGFAQEQTWRLPLKDLIERHVQEGFAGLDQRTVDVVHARVGLLTGEKMTLREVGRVVGVTRERIRQLEGTFWASLQDHKSARDWRRPHFLAALLWDLMDQSGSLVVRTDSAGAPLRTFIARAAGVPMAPVPDLGIVALGLSRHHLVALHSAKWFPDEVDAAAIAQRLESDNSLPLIRRDVAVLADATAALRRRRLNGTQRVYLSLNEIGRPAHYSEITEVHNSLFPERATTDRSVHGALSRQTHGVVWIGVRGKYALRHWGYERPSAGLFEGVVQIVKRVHQRTGKPVPFLVITAEMGRDRRLVNPSSLTIAAYCNPDLVRVAKDSFLPRGPDDQPQDDMTSEELDRLLRDFQQRA